LVQVALSSVFLQAGRDLRFLSFSMTGCFSLGAIVLMVEFYDLVSWCFLSVSHELLVFTYFSHFQLFSRRGYGLPGCWYALVGFQWVRPTIVAGQHLYNLTTHVLKTFQHTNFVFSGPIFPFSSATSFSWWHTFLRGLEPL
jgi:hypothetical protein